MHLKQFKPKVFLVLFLIGVNALSAQDSKSHASKPGVVLEEFLYKKAPFPQCHSASLVELQDGSLLSTFFGGTHERHSDVEIFIIRKPKGGEWSFPISVADGVQPDGTRYPTWNPVLFQPQGRPLMLFYKVGPTPSEWWGEFKTSKDSGKTWSLATKLKMPLLGPVKNKPIRLADGTILSGSSHEKEGWQVHIERSLDGGQTWNFVGPLNNPEHLKAIQPTLLTYPNGRIQLLARTATDDAVIAESWSDDGGLSWSEMRATSLPNNNSGIDAVSLQDGRQLLVYNHSTKNQEKMGHKGRGVMNLAVTKDGQHWEASLVLDYLDAPERHFAYPAVIQTSDGLVHIVYTWHRMRIKHVVINPEELVMVPIVDGEWPYDKIPLIPSKEIVD